jgi:hypothetical protein
MEIGQTQHYKTDRGEKLVRANILQVVAHGGLEQRKGIWNPLGKLVLGGS